MKQPIKVVFLLKIFKDELEMKEIFNGVFSAFGGAIGSVLGGFDGFLYALILFVVVDYITGVFVAIDKKTLSSATGFRGIAKKVIIFCLVAVANSIDLYVIGTGCVIRTAVIFFYLSNEGISILENTAALGLPVPKKLKKVLEQIKEEADDESAE